jgi:hypothetical protein
MVSAVALGIPGMFIHCRSRGRGASNPPYFRTNGSFPVPQFVACENLLDGGTTSNFINADFVKEHGFETFPLEKPRKLKLALDGVSEYAIDPGVTVPIVIRQHTERITCYVAPYALPSYSWYPLDQSP